MKKVLLIPTHNAKGNGGGIRVYNEALESLFRDNNELNVKIFRVLPHSSPLGNYYTKSDIANIENEHPDIIHINGYTSLIPIQLVKFARSRGIKVVYTPHWHPFETMKNTFLKKAYFNFFIKPIINKVDHICTINKEEYNYFKDQNNNISLISHWISSSQNFSVISEVRDSKMILFIGDPNYQNKGFDHFLALRGKGYNLHGVWRKYRNVPDDIIQHVNISDKEVQKLYRKAGLVVVPSKYEAFSYSALEALQYGTPVVMSNNVRIADFLSGVQGYSIFNYGDINDFVSKVKSTLGTTVDTSVIHDIFNAASARKKYYSIYQ